MDCTHYEELLSAALDGALNAAERRELDEHLAQCPACSALFDELSAQCAALRELDCQLPDGLHERILDSLPPQEKTHVKASARWRRWGALAACLALVAAAVLALPSLSGPAADPVPAGLTDADFPAEDEGLELAGQPASCSDDADRSVNSRSGGDVLEKAVPDIAAYAAPENAPDFYAFQNDQYLRVTYGRTPAPSARIIGSVQSLERFLAQFPEDDLSEIAAAYDGGYFQTGRLLAVLVEEPSGSINLRLAVQGLLWDTVKVLRREPETGTDDMAAWLILAETDLSFDDGDELAVAYIPWEE